jgi:predicted permease
MITVFGPLLLILATGVVFRLIPGVPDPSEIRRIIGAIVLHAFLPALTFTVLYQAPLTSDLWQIPVVAIIVTLTSFALSWMLFAWALRSRLDRPAIGTVILASTWANVTYLGLPVLTSVLGPEWSRAAITFDYLAMTPLLFTIGVATCMQFGTHNEVHTSMVTRLLAVLRLPPFIAAAIGLLLNVLHVPVHEVILKTTTTLGHTIAPLMIFSVGLALRPHPDHVKGHALAIAPVTVLKLVVAPMVAILVAPLVGLQGHAATAAILESGMPTMMLTMVFAERYGLDVHLLANTLLVTTLLSMLTLPVLAGF